MTLHPIDETAMLKVEGRPLPVLSRRSNRGRAVFVTICAMALGLVLVGAFAEVLGEIGGLQ